MSCPYHKRNYELGGENAGKCANDAEVNIATFPVEERYLDRILSEMKRLHGHREVDRISNRYEDSLEYLNRLSKPIDPMTEKTYNYYKAVLMKE